MSKHEYPRDSEWSNGLKAQVNQDEHRYDGVLGKPTGQSQDTVWNGKCMKAHCKCLYGSARGCTNHHYDQCEPQPNTDSLESSTIHNAIKEPLAQFVASHEDKDGKAHYDALLDSIQQLFNKYAREQVIAELGAYTSLQDELDATHFKPCKICAEPSHRCMCDQALMFVERKANDRMAELKENKQDE